VGIRRSSPSSAIGDSAYDRAYDHTPLTPTTHWWLEYDTGSMNLRDLREKLALYALAAQAGALAVDPPPPAPPETSAWPSDANGRRVADRVEGEPGEEPMADADRTAASAPTAARLTLVATKHMPDAPTDDLPLVLIVCPDYQQEALIRRMVQRFLTDGSLSARPGFRLRSTTRDLLAAGGPHDTIWLPLLPALPALPARSVFDVLPAGSQVAPDP